MPDRKQKELQCLFAIANDAALINPAQPGSAAPTTPFTDTDVDHILAEHGGFYTADEYYRGFNGIVAGKLKDGRWFCISGGYEWSGPFNCCNHGSVVVAESKEDLLQFGMDDDERKRLGIDANTGTTQ